MDTTDSSSEARVSDADTPRPLKHGMEDDNEDDEITVKLRKLLFGKRPSAIERLAVQYIVDNKLAPRVNASTFYARARSEVPTAKAGSVNRMWSKLKSFFNGSPEHDEKYKDLRGLMDVDKMIASFQAASFIDQHGVEHEEDPFIAQQEHQQKEHHQQEQEQLQQQQEPRDQSQSAVTLKRRSSTSTSTHTSTRTSSASNSKISSGSLGSSSSSSSTSTTTTTSSNAFSTAATTGSIPEASLSV
ncbi:MAG: hypothetical protein J3Q66DRAFT_389363 [Benniella sp.]|nr:MAG: hypothetical protein J3Q66DRAFT_389363 [Benniella sp.]